MKIKSFILLMLLIATLQSCSSPLDKNYNSETEKQDLYSIRKKIGDDEFHEVFLKYMRKIKKENRDSLSLKTYAIILEEARIYRKEEKIRLKKEYEEVERKKQLVLETKRRKEAQKIKEEENILNEKKELKKQATIKMLCDKKWGTYYLIPGFAQLNSEDQAIELNKNVFDVDADKNWIIFNKDGSCKVEEEASISEERSLNKPLIRKWRLEDDHIIFDYGVRKDSNYTEYKIMKLTSNSFEVIEVDKQMLLTITTYIKMKKIKK